MKKLGLKYAAAFLLALCMIVPGVGARAEESFLEEQVVLQKICVDPLSPDFDPDIFGENGDGGASLLGTSTLTYSEWEWIARPASLSEDAKTFYQGLEKAFADNGALEKNSTYSCGEADDILSTKQIGDIIHYGGSTYILAATSNKNDYLTAYFAFLMDHPEVFWLGRDIYCCDCWELWRSTNQEQQL